MNNNRIKIPGLPDQEGEGPIVILGPNGSGKTRLAQQIAQLNKVSAIGAQRRIYVDDSIPVEDDATLRTRMRQQMDRWRGSPWYTTEEINYVMSKLIQDHTNVLTARNEEAAASNSVLKPVTDTGLILLQSLWNRLFPNRKLVIGGFFPKVTRLDAPTADPYRLRQMSDGERSVLYMAARVLTAEDHAVLVDEPELHMHSRLAVQFWNEAEGLRPDCRFVYVTHDLNFALSRRGGVVLVARPGESAQPILVDGFPSSVAAEVLGAATLPFHAKRIFVFEGEEGRGFASELFGAWFDDGETFAIPAGDRDSVCAAVSGLRSVGVVAADVMGLVDRDFYPDEVLAKTTPGVTVLPLHEIESVLCDRGVAAALAAQLGKDPETILSEFLARVRGVFRGQTLSKVVASRVRARVGDLLDGAFAHSQIADDLTQTAEKHGAALAELDLPSKAGAMFAEESKRVTDALGEGGTEMLAVLPGKHLLSLLSDVLGLSSTAELTGMAVRSLSRRALKVANPLSGLGARIEQSLGKYLPPRKVSAD